MILTRGCFDIHRFLPLGGHVCLPKKGGITFPSSRTFLHPRGYTKFSAAPSAEMLPTTFPHVPAPMHCQRPMGGNLLLDLIAQLRNKQRRDKAVLAHPMLFALRSELFSIAHPSILHYPSFHPTLSFTISNEPWRHTATAKATVLSCQSTRVGRGRGEAAPIVVVAVLMLVRVEVLMRFSLAPCRLIKHFQCLPVHLSIQARQIVATAATIVAQVRREAIMTTTVTGRARTADITPMSDNRKAGRGQRLLS